MMNNNVRLIMLNMKGKISIPKKFNPGVNPNKLQIGDIINLKKLFTKSSYTPGIIAKIETPQAVKNIDEIKKSSVINK